MLSDLKDSQRPVQDADLVAFLYEPDMKSAVRNLNSKDEVKQQIAKAQLAWLESASVQALPAELRGDDWDKHLKRINLYVAKQRNGPTGDCQLVVVKPWMRLIDAHVGKEDGMKRAGVQVQKGFGGNW
jgi:replicative DNA helicase